MKYIFVFLLLFTCTLVNAQNRDIEVKIISNKYQTVRGQLKKVSDEGIAVLDYFGNYLIFRPNEIVRIKVRKRGLSIGEGAAGGALGGLAVGGLLLTLASEVEAEDSSGDLLKLTAALTVGGAAAGTVTGAIAQIINTKLTLKINQDQVKYLADYKKLEQYIIPGTIEHVN